MTHAMTHSKHGHERTPTRRRARHTGKYCAYCGRKRSDDEPTTADREVGVRFPARTFCDGDCERAWNIDGTDAHASPRPRCAPNAPPIRHR